MKWILGLIVIMTALGLSRPACAEMVVIVNKDNPLSSISRTDIEMIYLGKKKQFPGGATAMPVDIPAENGARRAFFATILGKGEEAYRLYWLRMIFSGKGQPPLMLDGEEDAVKFVSQNKGGIAFVDSGVIGPGVKAVSVSGIK